MGTAYAVSLLVIVAIVSAFLTQFFRRNRASENSSWLLMQQQIDSLRQEVRESLEGVGRIVNDRLQEQSRVLADSGSSLNERLDNATHAFATLHNELGQLKEGAQRVLEVGQDIALLQESLRAPKFRGGFGEFFLADLLAQVLPKEKFELQYGFRNGERVDAAIFSREGIIPIDSKFPLENFRRFVEATSEEEKKSARKEFVGDVKRHIDAIADKYIRPDEGTLNFALMYVPAENIYYETLLKDDGGLPTYAQARRVFPVSPNSFYAYLQTIAIGFRGMQIETFAHEIATRLERLRGDLEKFSGEFGQIGTHLKNARGKFDAAERRLDQFSERLFQMTLPTSEEAKPLPLKSVQS